MDKPEEAEMSDLKLLKLLNNMKHAEDYLKEQACGSQDGENYHAAETMNRAANHIVALEKKLDRIGTAASYACEEADEDWEKGRVVSIYAHDAVQALKAILDEE
jgi:hypothetical protein